MVCYIERMKKKDGYSLEEVRVLTSKMIDESVERLRKRLRAARRSKKYDTVVSMKKRKIQKKQEGYSPEELDIHMHAYIKVSAEQLRKELRGAKKQGAQKRRLYHAIAI